MKYSIGLRHQPSYYGGAYRGGKVETQLETIAAVAVVVAALTRVFVHLPTVPLYKSRVT